MRRATQRGFTLTELAIAIAVIALLLGSLVATLSLQTETRNVTSTERTLDVAREALIGFAIRNGRLPCAASATSNGREDPDPPAVATGACNTWDGFLPAVTLGISPRDASGFAIDAWNNRIRYRVSRDGTNNSFTKQDQLRNLGFFSLTPDLVVCVPSAGSAAASGCDVNFAAITTPAVIWSPGKNFATAGAPGADEAENNDNDLVFYSREPSPAGASHGEFDDILVWLPTNVLYSRLISAGPY